MSGIGLFSLDSDRAFAEKVAEHLRLTVSRHEERDFEDGEHKIRPLENVRGQDVYIVQSLYSDPTLSVNDKLMRLWFLLGALKDAGAERLTMVAPYLAYARKDRRTKTQDPLSLRYLAQLFEAMNIDRFVTLDAHDLAAFQNAFRCPTLHLGWYPRLIEHLRPELENQALTVASPDVGGIKRANPFREALEDTLGKAIPLALMEKHRSQGVVSGELVAGPLKDRTVIILDDLIASGDTLARAAQSFRQAGAIKVIAACTHGVFSERSAHILNINDLEKILISNTLPSWRLDDGPARQKLTTLDVSDRIAHCIRQMHQGGPIEETTS